MPYKAIALDLRLTELVLDAEQILDREQTAQDRAAPEEISTAPVAPRQKGLLAVVVFSVLSLLAAGAAGIWLFNRKGRDTAAGSGSPPSPDGEHPPVRVPDERIRFPCSSCGQKLRITTQLAGKKVKCPQCKTAIEVPAV